jgi:nitrogen fixation protein FixH
MKVKEPKQGTWKLSFASKKGKKNAYFMTVHYDSKLSSKIKFQPGKKDKENWGLTVEERSIDEQNVEVDYQVVFADEENPAEMKAIKHKLVKEKRSKKYADLRLETRKSGVYNITANIKGKTKNGVPFERTVVTSVYVDEEGNRYVSE